MEQREKNGAASEPIIILDEAMSVTAEEPTYIEYERHLDVAYRKVAEALRECYERRYRNAPPTDPRAIFAELDDEIVLPCAAHVKRLLDLIATNDPCTLDEEQMLMRITEDFLEQIKHCS